MYEPWARDLRLIDKSGQPMESVISFEFLLEPVTLEFIRFRGDQGLGHLVEPICPEVRCPASAWCTRA